MVQRLVNEMAKKASKQKILNINQIKHVLIFLEIWTFDKCHLVTNCSVDQMRQQLVLRFGFFFAVSCLLFNRFEKVKILLVSQNIQTTKHPNTTGYCVVDPAKR